MDEKKSETKSSYAGQLLPLAEAYITECGNTDKIPNIAGFCRYLGISASRFGELTAEHPEEAGQIRDVFEDEAINSDMPASLLGSYLKARLGYGDTAAPGTDTEAGQLRLIFEHDILGDGG